MGVVPIKFKYRVFPLQTAFDGSTHCCTYDAAVRDACGRARLSDIRERLVVSCEQITFVDVDFVDRNIASVART